jgi:hypothetical protein
MADILIENTGSIVLFRAVKADAQAWLEEHTDGQWFGNALAVEPRYVSDLVYGLELYGYEVEYEA